MRRVGAGIIKHFKYALVWGTSVKHRPQKVGRDHVLQDEDIVQARPGPRPHALLWRARAMRGVRHWSVGA